MSAIRSPGITKTCKVKNRESVSPAMNRTAEHQMHEVGSNEWDRAHDRCADTQPPVSVLVKTHHLSGESHAECEQQ